MMLKEKKIDFQRGCEEYIEEQGLYEIFEDMMRNLIINKPEDPVKFLIDKLEKPESKLPFHKHLDSKLRSTNLIDSGNIDKI